MLEGILMHIAADTLDDLMIDVLSFLLKQGKDESSTKGDYVECTGILLELTNPLARLSRTESKGTIFSCLGELVWYLSGSNDASFITHYIPSYQEFAEENNEIYGAYGPRLKAMHDEHNQIKNVIDILQRKQTTRQAVIQLFDASDISIPHRDIPCTLSLQFLLREDKLHMFTSMRSNDAFIGLPHDFFVFTMLQEIIAASLGCKLGTYKHFVGSLHLYKKNMKQAKVFLEEGFQSTAALMPEIPPIDIESQKKLLIKQEEIMRLKNDSNLDLTGLLPYWADLLILLKVFSVTKADFNQLDIEKITSKLSSNAYKPFIDKRCKFMKAKFMSKEK